MVTIITACISAISAIIVAYIGVRAKRTEEKAEKREKRREQESLLSMSLMDATMRLALVSSNALTNHANNGNVEEARAAAQKASDDYERFLREIASQSL